MAIVTGRYPTDLVQLVHSLAVKMDCKKEAFFFKKPCITLRDEKELTELVENGFNYLVGCESEIIYDTYNSIVETAYIFDIALYGDGKAGEKIIDIFRKEIPFVDD